MERFKMVRYPNPKDCGLESDPDGPYVLYSDALIYGSEQFGLGRLDGQADATAAPMPEPPPFTVESVHEAMTPEQLVPFGLGFRRHRLRQS